MKILIAGAGIGGIAAALCLTEAGFDVEVLERSPAIGEVGAGIQISPNGVKVLRRLGLMPALDKVGFRPEAVEMRVGATGARLFAVPMREEAERRFGAPYYHLHRADLIDMLAVALSARAPRALRVGKEITSLTQGTDGVAVTLSDGTRAEGDVLIGADGIHSQVRAQLFGAESPRFTGNVAWRLVVPAGPLKDLVPPTACVWTGAGRHAVTYYVRRGELVNFVGVVERDDWRRESWTERGDKSELAADFAGFAEPIAAIIERAQDCYRWALFDRDPLPRWSEGRATLLGDACHPMLPFLAQGAVMAIEDAWVLSRKLKAQPSVAAALAAYEAERKPRTSRVQRAAREQVGFYHGSGAASLALGRANWLTARLAPAFVRLRTDWIYGHDVVEGA